MEEYIDFLFSEHNDHMVFSDDLYDKLSANLEDNAKSFWDFLFRFFDGEEAYYSFYDFSEYEQLVERFSLSENGMVLTYLYHVREEIKNYFSNRQNYQLVKFSNSSHGLLLYRNSGK